MNLFTTVSGWAAAVAQRWPPVAACCRLCATLIRACPAGPRLAGAKSVQHIGAPFLIAGDARLPLPLLATCSYARCCCLQTPSSACCLPQLPSACLLPSAANCCELTPFLSLPTAAFDDAMLDKCAAAGLPCVPACFTSDANFCQDVAAFRAMGAVKVCCPAPQFVSIQLQQLAQPVLVGKCIQWDSAR